jgi:putative phosphoribosyl transferase
MNVRTMDVEIPIDGDHIVGTLSVAQEPPGRLVIFAHGSGSSRFSPRNQRVAAALLQSGLSTLLVDLLTPEEEREDEATGVWRFAVELLAERIEFATDWVSAQPALRDPPIGYFGASTGAAAALIAAADLPTRVAAVVSRGGRPDLAGEALVHVLAPTLLIVGSEDPAVIQVNEEALRRLATPYKDLVLVSGATHLFEEPGALEQVARHAREWFERFLVASADASRPSAQPA